MEFEKLLEKLGFTKEQFPTIESLLTHVEKLLKVSAKVAEIGLNVDELTKEMVLSFVALDELKATLSNESAKVTSLTAERDALKSKANERLDKIRLDAETKYRAAQLAASKEVDETIVLLLKESDEDKVISLAKNFKLELIGETKGTCVKCGSDNITFKSAKTEGTGGGFIAEKEADYLTTLAEKHSGFLN